jgi:quinol monooxygenase YgiN
MVIVAGHVTVDLLDPGRINLFERWESQEAVKTFRRRAPRTKQRAGSARPMAPALAP